MVLRSPAEGASGALQRLPAPRPHAGCAARRRSGRAPSTACPGARRRRHSAAPLRISAGTSSSVRASGPPCRFALVATTASTCSSTSARGRRAPGRARRSSPAPSPSASGTAAPGSGARGCTAPAAALSGARGSSGTSSSKRVDVLRQQRQRLLGRPLLQPVDLARGGFSVRVAAQPVHGVGRQHRRPPFAKGRDGLLDQARAPSRNPSTASRNCSGASTKIMWPVPGSTTYSGSGMPSVSSARADRPGDEVLLAGDHERRHRQARQQRPQVEVLPDLLLPEPRRVDAERIAVERGDVPLLALAVVGVVERHHPAGRAPSARWPSANSPCSSVWSASTASAYQGSSCRASTACCIAASCSGPWRGSVLARIRRSTRSGWLAAYSTATTPPCEWPSRSSCSSPRCSRSSSTSEA